MRWKSLVVLAALVVGLYFLKERRADQQAAELAQPSALVPLFPGFDPKDVHTVRVDNLERAVQVALERDGQGAWFMTDPVEYPADESVVQSLFGTLRTWMGEPVGGVSLADAGLDPPTAVLTLRQGRGDDAREFRMEVGGLDLDSSRIFVRVPGHPAAKDGDAATLLCTRAMATTLDRIPDDYRNRRATHLRAVEVIGFYRSGKAWIDEQRGTVDLDLNAERDGHDWRKIDSPRVVLDPGAMGLLARAASELNVERFRDDAPTSYAHWGLDPPEFSIRLTTSGSDDVTLHFGRIEPNQPGDWYCRRDDFPHVWLVDTNDVLVLTSPEDLLYDYFLVRAKRETIEKVTLRGGERELVLERASDRWQVSQDGAAPAPASIGAVKDALAVLEKSELVYPEGLDVGDEPASELRIVTDDGREWGGNVFGPYRGGGVEGRRFRRFGDQLVGAVGESVAALFDLTADDFRSMQIHRIQTTEVGKIEVEMDGQAFTYVHPNANTWSVEGGRFEAPRAFQNCLTTVLGLRAERWLERIDRSDVEHEIRFTVTGRDGTITIFSLARSTSGELRFFGDGLAAEIDHDQLAEHAEAWGAPVFDALLTLFEG